MSEIMEKVKIFLTSRKRAYQFTFNDGPHAQAVLRDLARFCRATDTTFHENERVHAVLEGRREVFLRIQNYLQLSPDDLWEKYRKE